MSDTMADFVARARLMLLGEDALRFDMRVQERARQLWEEHRRNTHTDFPIDPAEMRARYAELQERQKVLLGKREVFRSAAEDDELRQLEQRLHEMGKRIRQLDRAAAA
jgi:hypothetical protein